MIDLSYLLPVFVLFPLFLQLFRKQAQDISITFFLAPLAVLGLTIQSYILNSPIQLTFISISSFLSIGLKLDVLSGVITTTVLSIGLIIYKFSARHLIDDNPDRFLKLLSATLSCVLLMLLSPNLIQLFFSWLFASYFLHQLLLFFSQRRGAVKAAEQKFWVSRLGDFFLLSACALIFYIFKTVEFSTIFEMIKNESFVSENKLWISVSSFLLVIGAMTKSAQFPFHYWLPNTLEAPTPVSALMHAGVINAGGYLIIRMSPLVSVTPISLAFLAMIGAFTAFYASIIMLSQTSIKKNLAYSTIAQMGFMMLQCGLGAFSLALLHIIAHSFYKAYGFLSAGTSADFARINRYFIFSRNESSLWRPFIYAFVLVTVIFTGLNLYNPSLLKDPATAVLLTILGLAFSQVLASASRKSVAVGLCSLMILSYALFAYIFKIALADIVVTDIYEYSALSVFTTIFCAGLFIALYGFQNNLSRISSTKFGQILYAKALKGRII